jgi:hypothetical protein
VIGWTGLLKSAQIEPSDEFIDFALPEAEGEDNHP